MTEKFDRELSEESKQTGMQVEKGENKANELFRKVKSGDEEALHSLFLIYFPRLNDFAARIISDPETSQDITQEVFVVLWEKKDRIQVQNIESFLYKMVRNRCVDHIKHLKIIDNKKLEWSEQSKFEELYHIDFIRDEPYVLIQEELKTEIEKTIKSLPDRCREVFMLSRIDGLKNREIAEKLNINIKNVERHLSRALRTFRDKFSDELPLAVIILVLKSL
ncbi:MAG TPA: RNA polymerase sigma-70 factor [Prolixibacteraceae bacterium]|nr:RNA polymerase sigma-70 factor [Prolixibacteraceae bacterium]HCR90055.1 RNA polymerase sigma-70 factor [Prolixibacteraceae bacterium]HCU63774.1 RNA polymerase sigma-70 factor [Prolixibacteraceae bacterium]